MESVVYRIVPGVTSFFAVVDEHGNIISEGEDLRNVHEATKFAQDWASERGRTVSVITPKEERGRVNTGPMLYSASALRLIENFKDDLGRFVKQSAIDLAKLQGRALVTDDDVVAIIDQLDWTIPDEDA